MSEALARASHLKPEIRLAQAVQEFEATLTNEQKTAFTTNKSQLQKSPPDERDVMRLMAEIDRSCRRGRSSLGRRMTNFVHSVQQFTAVGDVLVGGSQNIFACGVVSSLSGLNIRIVIIDLFQWTVVRMSLLVSFSSLVTVDVL
jgi:hypothetical protein